jgi:hypothetical protein
MLESVSAPIEKLRQAEPGNAFSGQIKLKTQEPGIEFFTPRNEPRPFPNLMHGLTLDDDNKDDLGVGHVDSC